MTQCGDCNRVLKDEPVYELKEDGAARVCEDCFESYLEKWDIKEGRREQVKQEAKI